jgi:hypothetical protein
LSKELYLAAIFPSAVGAWKQLISRRASLCLMPGSQPGANLADENAARHAERANDEHADDDVRMVLQCVR